MASTSAADGATAASQASTPAPTPTPTARSAAASAGAAAAAAVAADKSSKTKLLTDLAQEVSTVKKVRGRRSHALYIAADGGTHPWTPQRPRHSAPFGRPPGCTQTIEALTEEQVAERTWIKETLKPGLNQMRSQLVRMGSVSSMDTHAAAPFPGSRATGTQQGRIVALCCAARRH